MGCINKFKGLMEFDFMLCSFSLSAMLSRESISIPSMQKSRNSCEYLLLGCCLGVAGLVGNSVLEQSVSRNHLVNKIVLLTCGMI